MTDDTTIAGESADALATAATGFEASLLEGKRVLVTGGGGSIGRACAIMFARVGAAIIVAGRDEQKLLETTNQLQALGAEASYRVLNIRDVDMVNEFYEFVDSSGGFDILVNSAGGQFPQEAIDFSVNGWNAVIDTNLNGSWWMIQNAAKMWRDANRPGNIINIVTVVDRGMPGVAHTCAARAGLVHLSKTIAVEWAPYNIRVNCVAPGVIESQGLQTYTPEVRNSFRNSNPMKKLGKSWDIAQACAFLAGHTSSFMTGQVVTVDGGSTLWGEFWAAGKPDYFADDSSGQ